MAVATEKIIPGVLPPKEETPDIDFLSIYDSFDPTTLTDAQLNQFAPRQPYVTAWTSEQQYYNIGNKVYRVPDRPIEERLHHGEFCVGSYRRDIEEAVASESVNWYKNARAALIQAIGMKACTEYVRRIYNSMSKAEMEEDLENWNRWSRYCDERREAEDHVYWEEDIPEGFVIDTDWKRHQDYIPIMSVKLQMVRKRSGLTQRDFAKRIGYNVNKYALLEQGKLEKLNLSIDNAFPIELIKAVVDLTYANPYWLLDESEDSIYNVDEDRTAMSVEEAVNDWDQYPMFVDAKVIRYWWGHRD